MSGLIGPGDRKGIDPIARQHGVGECEKMAPLHCGSLRHNVRRNRAACSSGQGPRRQAMPWWGLATLRYVLRAFIRWESLRDVLHRSGASLEGSRLTSEPRLSLWAASDVPKTRTCLPRTRRILPDMALSFPAVGALSVTLRAAPFGSPPARAA